MVRLYLYLLYLVPLSVRTTQSTARSPVPRHTTSNFHSQIKHVSRTSFNIGSCWISPTLVPETTILDAKLHYFNTLVSKPNLRTISTIQSNYILYNTISRRSLWIQQKKSCSILLVWNFARLDGREDSSVRKARWRVMVVDYFMVVAVLVVY